MLFNSLSYLLFLLLAVVGYWVIRPARRIWLVLVASAIFYGFWQPKFLLLIAALALVDFYLALRIGDEKRAGYRRLWLICSIATNLGLLAYFKYAHFLAGNLAALGGLPGRDWSFDPGEITLPLGISFYTFLSLSYTIDVYREVCRPTRDVILYLAYVMFWPHMIAGPIMRAQELIPQLMAGAPFDFDRVACSIRTILFGLTLKVALADQLAPIIADAFSARPDAVSALDVWTMAFGFGLQIYFDFAGYSMIAIGSAGLLGIRFPENFDWPYLASSPREFWKRWHITLSSWIRDYLYLPLSGLPVGSRSAGGLEIQFVEASSARLTFALFLTWFLMGLWHGANWTFAAWGLWHAAFIWLYRLITPHLAALPSRLRSLLGWGTTLAIVMLGWILFRSPSLDEAAVRLGRVLDWRGYTYLTFPGSYHFSIAAIFLAMLGARLVTRLIERSGSVLLRQGGDIIAIAVAGFLVVIFLRPTNQFIYFQF
jgi:D-alanyl-lipoteichoic acid acyltransferase DltB (MBOAT superfamily)